MTAFADGMLGGAVAWFAWQAIWVGTKALSKWAYDQGKKDARKVEE